MAGMKDMMPSAFKPLSMGAVSDVMKPMGFANMVMGKDKKKPAARPTIASGGIGLSDARPAAPIAASIPSDSVLDRFK